MYIVYIVFPIYGLLGVYNVSSSKDLFRSFCQPAALILAGAKSLYVLMVYLQINKEYNAPILLAWDEICSFLSPVSFGSGQDRINMYLTFPLIEVKCIRYCNLSFRTL